MHKVVPLLLLLLPLTVTNLACAQWPPAPYAQQFQAAVPTPYAQVQPEYYQPHPNAPCGPDWLAPPLRGLIPQGHMGADFRPACAAHDRCYTQPGWSRAACDQKYHRDLLTACNNSRFPFCCRLRAGLMYSTVRLFGEDNYLISQPARFIGLR